MKRFLGFVIAAFIAAAPMAFIGHAAEIYDWSNAAANNNSAPPDGFPENMNYSEVNDAARELMAVVKRYVEAVDGTNSTTGTEPNYALSSGQSLSTGAAGRVHVWTAHATSTGSVTLNVDAAGAKDVVDAAGTQLGSGAVVSGGVYMTVETSGNHRIIGVLSSPSVGSSVSSVTDNTVVRFDGTSGVLVQDTGITIDDTDNIAGITTLDVGSTSTTLSEASAGDVDIEGNIVYRAGGTDVPVTDGGTGASAASSARDNLGLATVGQSEAEAGTSTTTRAWTAERVSQAIAALTTGLQSVNIQEFSSSGTYTPSSGTLFALAISVGGGGGGGGADCSDSTSAVGAGGGSSGTLSIALLTAVSIGASQTVTIGAGGASGTGSTGGDGGNGGTTSVGSLLVALGGLGGSGESSANIGISEAGGDANDSSGNTGDIVSDGNAGFNGLSGDQGSYRSGFGGNGGASFFGGSGRGGRVQNTVTSNGDDGHDGTKGGGGGGGGCQASPNAGSGGGGGAGYVMITELGS